MDKPGFPRVLAVDRLNGNKTFLYTSRDSLDFYQRLRGGSPSFTFVCDGMLTFNSCALPDGTPGRVFIASDSGARYAIIDGWEAVALGAHV